MKTLICLLLCAWACAAELHPACDDPTHACQDLVTARSCGVVGECARDVWADMTAPPDNDQICDICKEMVKEARDQLLSNMTQEEIKEVFEGSCKLLPIKLVADACIKVVDEIIPQLVEMLASRMDPNMVCTVSGLCNAIHSPLTKDVSQLLMLLLQDDKCQQCTQLVVDAQTFIKSSSEAETKIYVEKLCDLKLSKYLCDIIMNEYFHEAYTYIKNADPKQLCSAVGVCPVSEGVTVRDELTCEFCEHVLQHVKDEMTANTTVEEFKTALLNFCKLTGKFSSECTSLVDNYCDTIFDYLRKMDTRGACTLIGLCTTSARIPLVKIVPAVETRNRIPLIRLQPATRVASPLFRPLLGLIPADLQYKRSESNDIFRKD